MGFLAVAHSCATAEVMAVVEATAKQPASEEPGTTGIPPVFFQGAIRRGQLPGRIRRRVHIFSGKFPGDGRFISIFQGNAIIGPPS